MTSSAPGHAPQPPVPLAISSSISRWCARLSLGGIALMLAIQTLSPGSPGILGDSPMPAGSAIVLGSLGAAVLAALRGRTRLARTVGLASILLAAPLMLVAGATLTGVADGALGAAAGHGWRPVGHAATVHLLLGVALLATLVPSHRLVLPRMIGLAAGLLAPLVSLSVQVVRGEGYALLPGVVPLTAAVAIATLLTTFAIAALGLDRWPIRTLLQHPSDLALVGRLLPFVLLVPFVAPSVVALARTIELDERATIVLATLLPMLGLCGLLAVTVRGQRRLLGEIESRKQQLLTVLDGLPIAVMVRAQDGTLLHRNPGTEDFLTRLGVGPEAIHGSASDLMAHIEVVDEDERPYVREKLPVVSAIRDGRSHDATVGFALPHRGYAWYSVRAAPTPLTDGSMGTIVTLDDITEQLEARRHIRVAERSSRLTFEHAPIGVAILAPGGELLRANTALCDLLGYPDHEHLVTAGIGAALLAGDREDPARDLLAGLPDGRQRHRVERQLPHHDGHRVPTELSIALVRDDQDRPLHLIVQVVDLSERRALEAELRAAASHDPLTGLVNRRALAERLQAAQTRQERDGTDIGLLFIDLDRFKTINDNYGHETGDRLLIEVGRDLLTATRRSDTVCRMGGDEFVILCTPIDGTAGLHDILDRLEVIQPAVEVTGVSVTVGHSVGAVLVGPDEDLDAALRRADTQMYLRKRASDDPALEVAPQRQGTARIR